MFRGLTRSSYRTPGPGLAADGRVDKSRVEKLLRVEAYSKLLAMTVMGAEYAIGEKLTSGLANLAGRELYRIKPVEGSDLQSALASLNRSSFRLDTYRGPWGFIREEDGGKAFYLVARECPVRQVIYLEDLPAGHSLCKLMHFYLDHMLHDKLGGVYRTDLVRYGPNACLLRVVVRSGAAPGDVDVVSEKPSEDEYIDLLLEDFRALLKATARALDRTLGGNIAMSYRAGKEYGRRVGDYLLAELSETVSVDEALRILDEHLGEILVFRKLDGVVEVTSNIFMDVVREAGVENPTFVYRIVQGFIAGVLEELSGRRVDVQSLDSEGRKFKVLVR